MMKLSEQHGRLVDTFMTKFPQSSFTLEQLQLATKKIAQLEAELDDSNIQFEVKIAQLEAELASLRAQKHTICTKCGYMKNQNELEADNDRLREGLDRIIGMCSYDDGTPIEEHGFPAVVVCAEVALKESQ